MTVLRALLLAAGASALGLAVNALSPKPVPIWTSSGPGAWPEKAPRVAADALPPDALILDVRGDAARKEGRPARSLGVSATSFAARYPELAATLKAAPSIVVLCESEDCPAADRVAKSLRELGHGEVRVFHGGWRTWTAAGLPAESGP